MGSSKLPQGLCLYFTPHSYREECHCLEWVSCQHLSSPECKVSRFPEHYQPRRICLSLLAPVLYGTWIQFHWPESQVGREDSGWPCPPPSPLTPTVDSQWAVGLMTLKGGSLHFSQILSSAFCLRFDILVTELRLYYETLKKMSTFSVTQEWWECLPMISSKSFIVFGLTLRSLICSLCTESSKSEREKQ